MTRSFSPAHARLEFFDHLGKQVHGRDRTVEMPGEHLGLMSGAAADIGDAEPGARFGKEFQCPEGLFVTAGTLPFEGAEKAGYKGEIEFEDRFFVFFVHGFGCLGRLSDG